VLGGALIYGGSAQGAKNAGSYAIAPSGLSSGNYAIGFVDGTLTISPAAAASASGTSSQVENVRAVEQSLVNRQGGFQPGSLVGNGSGPGTGSGSKAGSKGGHAPPIVPSLSGAAGLPGAGGGLVVHVTGSGIRLPPGYD
jgi:hypothetical protein